MTESIPFSSISSSTSAEISHTPHHNINPQQLIPTYTIQILTTSIPIPITYTLPQSNPTSNTPTPQTSPPKTQIMQDHGIVTRSRNNIFKPVQKLNLSA